MLNQTEQILADVTAGANARTAELLPLLMAKNVLRDSMSGCVKHDELRVLYIEAQIALTRAKRNYELDDYYNPHRSLLSMSDDVRHSRFSKAVIERDKIRIRYRGTPCTCWVPKR